MITVTDINQNEENYVWWLTIMADELPRLCLLPKAVRSALDFSIESLDILEKYILDNYTLEEMRDYKNKYARDLFSRYVGETFRKNIPNMRWAFEFSDKKNIFYGLPVIQENDGPTTPMAPSFFVTALIDRQQGDYLSSILRANIVK
jgi:hypothetical protein